MTLTRERLDDMSAKWRQRRAERFAKVVAEVKAYKPKKKE